jgi:hypothetical protein
VNPAVKINEPTLQPRFILLPPDTIDSRRSLTLESVEAIAQQRCCHVVDGLSVPGDIAFVGFDNVRYSKYLHVPLTSIDQSTSRLGETAAQLALDLIARKIEKPKTILLAPTLVVRESTIGLKAAAKQAPVAGQPSPWEPQARRRLTRR